MVACHIVNGCDLDGLSKARAVSMSVCVESTRSPVITIMSGPLSDSIRSSTDTVQNATPFFRENLFFIFFHPVSTVMPLYRRPFFASH